MRSVRSATKYPGGYWREVERRAYPEKFVHELTESGYLAALIPERVRRRRPAIGEAAVILEEIHRSRRQRRRLPRADVHMGTLLRHGSEEQKARYLPRSPPGELRLQAFGVTEPDAGSDTTRIKTRAVRDGDRYVVNGQKIWISRALQSDLMLLLARTTPLEAKSKRRTDGLSVFLVDMREAGARDRRGAASRMMINHHSTELFFDELRMPADAAHRRGGQGLPLHPRRHERRAHA